MLTDHLGNVRALITDANKNGILTADEILQKGDYYAFGREITPGLVPSPNNNYKYNKKEFQSDLGELDYGARFYDPVIARWNVIDPMSEVNRRWSPYDYVKNNPIINTDPDGMIDYNDISGSQEFRDIYQQTSTLDDPETRKRKRDASTTKAKADALKTASKALKNPPKKRDQLQLVNFKPTNQGTISKWPPDEVNYNDFGNPNTSAELGSSIFNTFAIVSGGFEIKAAFSATSSIKGGLNLFKFGSTQAETSEGWATGDNFLKMFDRGSPKLNWQQNSGFLRQAMREGKHIFDSYLKADGSLQETGGFLNAERNLLQSRGWTFNQSIRAWIPPK